MNIARNPREQPNPTTYDAMNAKGMESMRDAAMASSKRAATVAKVMMAGMFFIVEGVEGSELLQSSKRNLPPKGIIGAGKYFGIRSSRPVTR
jgi:hypothetical protein